MASKSPALRILEDSRVSAPPKSVATASLPLTFFDIIWLTHHHPVERLFFYHFPHPTAHFMDSCLPNLKSSLSLTLQHFFPLAGNLRRSPGGSDDRYEIYYVDGDSVPFTVAEHDGAFHDLSDAHACDISKLLLLVPQLPKSRDAQPLLALQVTVFPNHGIAIGVSVHHIACDGSSSIHFMKSWASVCKAGGSSMPAVVPPPLLDRTLISDPQGLYSVFLDDAKSLEALQNDKPSGEISFTDMVHATFSFKQDQIQRLKRLVLARAAERGTSFHCSTIVVVFAYVWVCLVRMRGLASERKAYLAFLADCRERLQPPLPAAYFGNCVRPCVVEVTVSDVIGEEGFVAAAEAIGKAIEGIKDGVLDDAERWIGRALPAISEQPMTVAGSPKFRVYETDFGWGGPKKVLVTSILGLGATSVAESKEEQGGIEIGMVLLEHVMDEFRTHFLNGLKLFAE